MSSFHLQELTAVTIYLMLLVGIGILSYRRHLSSTDFIIGNRSLNYWLTALAAHASDMSSWLFMGYPAVIFAKGLVGAWAAVGLIIFMFLNWQFLAPKMRIATEAYNSLTFSSFFENRFADTSGVIRIVTACMSLVFYTIYISAGLVGLGLLVKTLFGIPYDIGILIGILIVIPYVFIGGYLTLAWIDFVQGLFLLCVIIFVPLYVLPHIGGFEGIAQLATLKNKTLSFFPNFSTQTLEEIFFMVAGWGLGYFGQPHIITKFMGIRRVKELSKAKLIGMSWMILSLSAATLVGMVSIAYFSKGIADSEQVFIQMVKDSFPPFVIGFTLCAVLAATINAMSSQVLVLSSSITEDFYKRLFRRTASSRELLLVSRLGVILVALIAFMIAYGNISTIYSLVLYAWSGLGSSFGPLLLFSLYSKRINKQGAWAGILAGGLIAAFWPLAGTKIPSMLTGFSGSALCIILVSYLFNRRSAIIERS